MGSTESQGQRSKLDCEYRLVRRYISDLYAGSEVTVVEQKQTKQQHILKEFIQQLNPDKLSSELEAHRSLSHRNLIQLQKYWIENDINICSSLFKVYAIFQYHENTLEDWLSSPKEELTDRDVADLARQLYGALGFLQRNRVSYLLAGPKSIAVVQNNQKTQEAEAGRETPHRRSYSKLLDETKDYHRRSFVDINRESYLTHSKDQFEGRPTLKRESSTLNSKRCYKIFHPIEGTGSTRSLHNISSYLQVPLHPHLAISPDFTLSSSMVHQQNLLTVGMIALSICEACQVSELDIFKCGRLSLEKFMDKVYELRLTHPRTSKEIMKAMGNPLTSFQQPLKISQGLKIKEVPMIRRKRESKTNLIEEKENLREKCHQKLMKASDRNIAGMTLGRVSSKRISLLQL